MLRQIQYDAFCSHVFDFACLRSKALVSKRFETMENLYTSKIFSKMTGGLKMHIPNPTPLDPPLATGLGIDT